MNRRALLVGFLGMVPFLSFSRDLTRLWKNIREPLSSTLRYLSPGLVFWDVCLDGNADKPQIELNLARQKKKQPTAGPQDHTLRLLYSAIIQYLALTRA